VTGDVYPSSGGFHLYILVENGVDIPRFLRVVQDLCWLHGLAGFWITKDGKLDEYSIVDVSVGSAERLVFEADPKVNQPLVQAPRPATLRGGNTALATTEINADKSREKISKLKSSAKSKLKAAAAEVRENYITEKANELEARGVDPITARETAEKFVKDYVLGPEMTVEFIESELGVVDVATILADPARFDHQSCFDPVEGRDYGRANAMFFADRRVIHSFAHGRRKFKLCAKSDEPPTARNEGETIFSLGIEKRLTSFESLNERFAIMQVSGQPSVYISRPDLMPIQDIDLSRRLMSEVVYVGDDQEGNPIYVSAFKFWTENANRHVYRRIVFTNKPVQDDSYNLYRGLGVVPREGQCELIKGHIKHVFCSDIESAYEAMLDLMGWQIQNVGMPSRIIVVLRSKNQQTGKGIILEEVLLKIYGPSGFSPSSTDQILGRFNDAIRGRVFMFCDEVLFAGDLKSANAMKALSTTTFKGLEAKFITPILYPVGVNLWLAGNADQPVHMDEGDARHWALHVNEDKIGDDVYFADLFAEIENGGREAFAHFLLNRDVSGFVPKRDVPRNNAERTEQIIKSINPYDARCWLRECALAVLDGQKVSDPWEAGAEKTFGELWTAYGGWQQSRVKSRAAPKPTPAGNFGEVLGRAGFHVHKTTLCNMRVTPSPADCLKALDTLDEWNPGGPRKEP